MTNKEAEEWLKSIKERIHGGDERYDQKRHEALDMAISALERQKCENCKILELLVDMEIPTICEDDYNDCEYCEQNCNFKAPTKECYLHWADMRKESE